jgi:hypothetical protein
MKRTKSRDVSHPLGGWDDKGGRNAKAEGNERLEDGTTQNERCKESVREIIEDDVRQGLCRR